MRHWRVVICLGHRIFVGDLISLLIITSTAFEAALPGCKLLQKGGHTCSLPRAAPGISSSSDASSECLSPSGAPERLPGEVTPPRVTAKGSRRGEGKAVAVGSQ